MVIARTKDAIYIRLPRAVQISRGPCSCGKCDGQGFNDTLVVATKPDKRSNDYTYTVHMPDRSIEGFLAYVASKEKPKPCCDGKTFHSSNCPEVR